MSIDTKRKRASILGFGLVSTLLIFPDGAIEAQDKQTFLSLYSGTVVDAPDAATPDCILSLVGAIDAEPEILIGLIDDTPIAVSGIIDAEPLALTGKLCVC